MSVRKPVTDTLLEAERARGRFYRGERLENAINWIVVWGCRIGAIVGVIFLLYSGFLYALWMKDHAAVPADTINVIERIFTYVLAVGGGYLVHVLQIKHES